MATWTPLVPGTSRYRENTTSGHPYQSSFASDSNGDIAAGDIIPSLPGMFIQQIRLFFFPCIFGNSLLLIFGMTVFPIQVDEQGYTCQSVWKYRWKIYVIGYRFPIGWERLNGRCKGNGSLSDGFCDSEVLQHHQSSLAFRLTSLYTVEGNSRFRSRFWFYPVCR